MHRDARVAAASQLRGTPVVQGRPLLLCPGVAAGTAVRGRGVAAYMGTTAWFISVSIYLPLCSSPVARDFPETKARLAGGHWLVGGQWRRHWLAQEAAADGGGRPHRIAKASP